jgi:diaminopimelate epimerase
MRFSRWHAHGNVYLLAERAKVCGPLRPEAVRDLCRDADGIVEVVGSSEDAAEVVIWNRDGSTAEMSGNGTRIAARWLFERTDADHVRVRVGNLEIAARRLSGDNVEQDLGDVQVYPRERVADLEVVPVTVGNPHAVVIGDPDDLPVIGPLLERHPRFPERTNVEAVRVERSGDVHARVWERGVGETSASGTGAVAVAAATHPAGGDVVVHFPGGDLAVRLDGPRAYLTGPAERIA